MKLLTMVAIGSVFAATSAFAANMNDGPVYPNMESHKTYAAYRNQDHNNPSPRYAVTAKTVATPKVRVTRAHG